MIKRGYIDNKRGGQIHIAEAGVPTNKQASILFIHQTPRSWDEFREVMELMKSDCHLIAMDLPGMGASSVLSKPPTIEEYAEAAALVIEHYGSEAMTICGHHTGGVVAIELAATQPQLVESLILSSTPWLDPEIRIERKRKMSMDSTLSLRDGYHLIDLWRQRSPYYPDNVDHMDRFMKDALRANAAAAGHIAVGQYHMELAVPKVECPVLLVEHMKDPFAVKHTSHLKAAFQHAVMEHIPNGHVALEVTAPEFCVILRKWIFRTPKLRAKPVFKIVKN